MQHRGVHPREALVRGLSASLGNLNQELPFSDWPFSNLIAETGLSAGARTELSASLGSLNQELGGTNLGVGVGEHQPD